MVAWTVGSRYCLGLCRSKEITSEKSNRRHVNQVLLMEINISVNVLLPHFICDIASVLESIVYLSSNIVHTEALQFGMFPGPAFLPKLL
jgi:hypothetical protein